MARTETSDICSKCGTPMPVGQRYCLRCAPPPVVGEPIGPAHADRLARLTNTINTYTAAGWVLVTRLDVRAELASTTGPEHLYLEIQPDGSIGEQHYTEPAAGQAADGAGSLWQRRVKKVLRRGSTD